MALITSKEIFAKALNSDYAIGAFNVNNMEIIQGIVEAGQLEKSPLILQVSAGARKYARPEYLRALVNAAIEETGVDVVLHLDHAFVRISNSEIINLKKVKSFDLSFAGTICVTLSNGQTTYVSRRYVSKIKQVLGM